jgi:hypothetical protein
MLEAGDASAFQVTPGALPESAGPGANLSPADYTLQRIDSLSRKYAEESASVDHVQRQWRWPEFALIAVAILIAVVATLLGGNR